MVEGKRCLGNIRESVEHGAEGAGVEGWEKLGVGEDLIEREEL